MSESDLIAMRAAEVQAATARAMIRAMGMYVFNQERLSNGLAIGYDEKAFIDLIDEEGISHNAVTVALRVY